MDKQTKKGNQSIAHIFVNGSTDVKLSFLIMGFSNFAKRYVMRGNCRI